MVSVGVLLVLARFVRFATESRSRISGKYLCGGVSVGTTVRGTETVTKQLCALPMHF